MWHPLLSSMHLLRAPRSFPLIPEKSKKKDESPFSLIFSISLESMERILVFGANACHVAFNSLQHAFVPSTKIMSVDSREIEKKRQIAIFSNFFDFFGINGNDLGVRSKSLSCSIQFSLYSMHLFRAPRSFPLIPEKSKKKTNRHFL